MINLNNESYNMDYSNQMNRLHMIKKDDSTESKQKIMGKLSMLASEMPTPNLINQITFNDQDLNEEFKFVNEQKQIEEL